MSLDFEMVEKAVLPPRCHFDEEARNAIACFEDVNVLACPGCGKTTVLLAKLKILASRMPFAHGRGICVLSHTNVAVDEIKGKLGVDAHKILSYPNFAGTVQSFIDKYVAFPYLRCKVHVPLRTIDRAEYAVLLWRKIRSAGLRSLKYFVEQRWKSASERIPSVEQYLEGFSFNKDAALCYKGKPVAQASSSSARQYRQAKTALLEEDGVVIFDEAYQYAGAALQELGHDLRNLLSQRFAYVLVDEYQDCSQLQRDVIDGLFEGMTTVVQKIGDKDQAIYGGVGGTEEDWKVKGNSLKLSRSNRYGDAIANVLTLLRSGKDPISTVCPQNSLRPVLFVYRPESKGMVLKRFIKEIAASGLGISGVYKAIGMYQNVSGLKIGDYWGGFKSRRHVNDENHWGPFIKRITRELSAGRLYGAEREVVGLIQLVARTTGWRMEGRFPTKRDVREWLKSYAWDAYAQGMLDLASVEANSPVLVDSALRKLLDDLPLECGGLKGLSVEFFEEVDEPDAESSNQYRENDGPVIHFDTVHGVKGETHDATLYLETERNKGTDLQRVIPLLENKPLGKAWIHEQCRRCVYVGFSRPRTLLCVAIQKETYRGHEQAFSSWKVVDV